MLIKIRAPFKGAQFSGLYGAPTPENPSGEYAIGQEITVENVPAEWEGRYDIVSEAPKTEAQMVVNPEEDLDRDALKAEADALGIEYARNISTPKLKELIDAKKAEGEDRS